MRDAAGIQRAHKAMMEAFVDEWEREAAGDARRLARECGLDDVTAMRLRNALHVRDYRIRQNFAARLRQLAADLQTPPPVEKEIA